MSNITLTKSELASTIVTLIVLASLSKFENEINIKINKIKIQRISSLIFIHNSMLKLKINLST